MCVPNEKHMDSKRLIWVGKEKLHLNKIEKKTKSKTVPIREIKLVAEQIVGTFHPKTLAAIAWA